MISTRKYRPPRRRGAIAVLSAFLMVGMLAMVALAIDVGYLQVARTQLQQSADAAALAIIAGFDAGVTR